MTDNQHLIQNMDSNLFIVVLAVLAIVLIRKAYKAWIGRHV